VKRGKNAIVGASGRAEREASPSACQAKREKQEEKGEGERKGDPFAKDAITADC